VGHSLGGAASLEACRQDAACAGAVDLDGTLWTEVRHTGLAAPSLLLAHGSDGSCDDFCERASADFATVREAPDAQQFSIAGTTHQNFIDFALMWGPVNKVSFGSIDPSVMSAITRDLVLSFLDVHVRDAPAASFSEAIARHAEVEAVQ
jgi:pimeloyl-ACP methyl ester carboxylesterase